MRLVKWSTLVEMAGPYPEALGALEDWRNMVRSASWTSPAHLQETAGFSPRVIPNGRVIFRIRGNAYRLVCAVRYATASTGFEGIVMIKFFGTHAEYDRIDATEVEP